MSEKSLKIRYMSSFLPSSDKRRLVVLTGARQTGKTTLAKLHYPHLRYINLDAPENREGIRRIATSAWSQSVGNAVIDEAQKEPVVFEKVKYAFDEHAVSFTLLLGSSQILLLKKVRESLAGRVALYELWPLLMSELARVPDTEEATFPLIGRILSSENFEATMRDLPQTLFDDEAERLRSAEAFLLTWGGMPALLDLSAEEKRKWLRNYEYTYLERDLGDLARLDDLGPFRKFQKLAALRSGCLLNYSELARDAGVSVDTARRYLEYLRLSYQVILLQPFARNLTSQVIKAPKLYWLDVGLMRQLSGIRGEHVGEVYETMVVSELYKWINTTQHSAEMFFYRSRSGMEVDLILKTDFGYFAIEIKGRQRLASKDVRAIKAVADALGDDWLGGLVVYNGDDVLRVSEPSIWAVPSYRLLT